VLAPHNDLLGLISQSRSRLRDAFSHYLCTIEPLRSSWHSLIRFSGHHGRSTRFRKDRAPLPPVRRRLAGDRRAATQCAEGGRTATSHSTAVAGASASRATSTEWSDTFPASSAFE
jgi:hypothetical protein